MLNLSEQWKKAYAEYLVEEEEKLNEELDKVFVELSDVHDKVQKGFRLVESYFEIYNLSENIVLEYDPNASTGNAPVGNHSVDTKQDTKVQSNITDVFKALAASDFVKDLGNSDYTPTATYTVQTVGDMKFPANIIFFIKQLITWVKNIVLYFIERFKNIIRRLLGDHKSVTEIDMDKLKLNLTSAKKIEGVSTSFSVGRAKGPIEVWKIPESKVLAEGLTDTILKPIVQDKPKTERIVVTLDFSRDIEDLKLLVQHFYDLFDGAFGSFNEKLFDTQDLKLILELFNDTLQHIKTGDPAREVTIGGSATEVQAVSASRVKENLINTNENINKLKMAYVQTAAKIKDMAKIINSKELLMLSDLGVEYQMLTSATLTQMMPIMQSLLVRIKEASKMEKELDKVKREYEALVKKLSDSQRAVMSISNITYNTVYARRLNDLFVAARYMSDIVTLRLSGLGLYIKELKDVRDILTQLNGLNRNILKGKLK